MIHSATPDNPDNDIMEDFKKISTTAAMYINSRICQDFMNLDESMNSMISYILIALLFGRGVVGYGRKVATLATFNTALGPYYSAFNGTDRIPERTTLLIQQIKESKADVFCLQEVFLSNVQRDIVAELYYEFPYSFSAQSLTKPATGDNKACTGQQIETMYQCLKENCPGSLGERNVTYCVLRCMNMLKDFSVECRNCFSLQLAKGSASCAILPASNFETNYGLLILSKKKLKNTKATPFAPSSQFKGFLEASIDGVGNLTCTHLSGLLDKPYYYGPPFEYPLKYSSHHEQQYTQIQVLFNLIQTKEHPILMGFFNHGPASPGNLTWKLPIHYGLMHSRGLYSPYVLEDGRCTVCTSNSATNSTYQDDVTVDHIYLPTVEYKRILFSTRIFDDVESSNCESLSTHYGVQVSLIEEEEEDHDEVEEGRSSLCQHLHYNEQNFLNMDPLSQYIMPLCAAI